MTVLIMQTMFRNPQTLSDPPMMPARRRFLAGRLLSTQPLRIRAPHNRHVRPDRVRQTRGAAHRSPRRAILCLSPA